jgi:hypothetical protein
MGCPSAGSNTSLYALGSVIERLSASSRAGGGGAHVPYRDSKLTRLLQEALGGSSCSAIVVTLRTESANLDETIGTLRFAQRAKAVPVTVRPLRSGLGSASKLAAELESVRDELATARRLIEKLQAQLFEADTALPAEAQVREIMSSLGGGDSASKLVSLELENRQLRKRNLTLRATSIWQRLMGLRHAEARRTLERRERAHEEQISRLGATAGRSTFALDARAAADGAPRSRLAAITGDRILHGGGGEHGVHGSDARGFFSPGPRPHGKAARRMTLATLTEEGRRYLKFHEIATHRKLSLASRGYEAEGVFIEELYDEAKRLSVPAENWHEYLRSAIPSPETSPAGLRAGGGLTDLSQTAPASVFSDREAMPASSRSARKLGRLGRAHGSVHKVALPFSSSWGSLQTVEPSACAASAASGAMLLPSDLLSATELLAVGCIHAPPVAAPSSVGARRASPSAAAAAAAAAAPASAVAARVGAVGGRPVYHPPRIVTSAGGATLLPGKGGATSQLTFRDGYEGWRADMQIAPGELSSAEYGEDAARPALAADALRHGAHAHPDSAFSLTTAAHVAAAAAEVRAAPAKRATNDAAKSALRAAAAAEDARYASQMANAARAQVVARSGAVGELSPETARARARAQERAVTFRMLPP